MSDESTPDQPDVVVGAVSDGVYTLLIADFADTDVGVGGL